MLGRRAFGTGAAAAALTFSRGRLATAQASSKVLRVVPQAEPQSFDPVFTQVNNVSMHGAMIYDQLFGWDDKMNVQPQMVDDWKTTDDRLLYTFTLRRGLKFHDGGDVTTRDVVASLKRMFVRDGQNQLLAGLIDEYQRIDDRSFSIRLKAPFAFTEFLLGGSNGVVGAIMREKDAMTDPFTQVKERIGSGPFRFIDAEYRPGAKLVYEKFDGYVPRSEPASGFAGGKVVKVDRVEWVIIPDTSVAFNALRSGEVDMLDAPPLDLLPTVANDRNIVIGEVWPLESYAVLRFNSIHPPFNDVKARRAVAHAFSQTDYMSAAYGDPKLWHECYAYWVCGSPNGTEIGSEPYRTPNLDRARQLVREFGLRWHADSADRRFRHSGLSEAQSGHCRSLAEDRLQGRSAALGLGQRSDAATEEGPAGAGRLESVPHQRERRTALQSADQPLHHYHLRWQEFSWMAVRPIGGGHETALHPRARRGKADGIAAGHASSSLGCGTLSSTRSVRAAVSVAQQHLRRAALQRAGILEHQ